MMPLVVDYIDSTRRPPLEYASLCALLGNGRLVLHKVDDLYPRRPWRRVLGRLIVVGGLLAAAIVFAPIVMAVLGAAALVAVTGLGAHALMKPFLPQPKIDDVRPRKAWFQRVFAAGGVGVSLVAGRQLRRDTRRYLDFGTAENEKFLVRSRERWPQG